MSPVPVSFTWPQIPGLPDWGFLKPYMWPDALNIQTPGPCIRLRARLIPACEVPDAKAVRRAFLDTFDTVLDLLAANGLIHARHPVVEIRGQVVHHFDAPDEFTALTCDVDFDLLWPRR